MKKRRIHTNQLTSDRKLAYKFILLMGIISLLGDIVYEGARSISGPYLAFLGAGASIIGIVGGIGEFVGYALRLVFGYFADKTKAYWTLTIIGYGLLLSIPLLAFSNSWQIAAFLLIMERMGKAIRSPARDAILSHATKQVGRGWGFGIHEALDQIGAIIGPLIFSAVFLLNSQYKTGFGILIIPVVILLMLLFFARSKVPSPQKLEVSIESDKQINSYDNKNKWSKTFWLYTFFTLLSVMGFVQYPIIAYHLNVNSIISNVWIPIFYAIAMGIDGITALIIGRTYDNIGLKTLLIIPIATLVIPFFAFSYSKIFILFSIIIWGIVMGIHETIMRAAIADLIPLERRGTAYGIFNTVYGLSMFIGGTSIGFLYEISLSYVVTFVVIIEIISLIFLYSLIRNVNQRANA
ncbi:MFS transporter [Defluviitoga tunisiensis]|nr:MFS transporter [Defluviitoga tunisiensis]HPZ66519.1 MFS transporter [Defluviitoga tunisiensis]HQD43284.1 MFS transporter [Defluviitoga tunisiensis]